MYEKSVTEDLFQILGSEYDLKTLFWHFYFGTFVSLSCSGTWNDDLKWESKLLN